MNTENTFLKFGFLAIAIILLTACPQEDKITEPAGLAKYFIDNRTGNHLFYGIGEKAVKIESNTLKQIFQTGTIGIKAPLPSDGLGGRLRLYLDDKGTPVYEQNPIENSRWIEDKQDDRYYGLVHYTLAITADMIN